MMGKRRRSGISLGTVVMLTLTALVLVGFFALLPSFTGNQDIRLDAAELAVAIDHSFSQLTSTAADRFENRPQGTALPPQALATAIPAQRPAQPTSVPTPTISPKHTFTLSAAGNIELNSSMRKTLTYNDSYHFEILTDQIQSALSADLSIATLRHTVSEADKLSDTNMPAQLLEALQTAGVNTLSIGHEDVLNLGVNGLKATMSAVRRAGMLPIGAYDSTQERGDPSLMNLNGASVAVLHYLDEVSSSGRKKASEDEISSSVHLLNPDQIKHDIQSAKDAGANVVVLSLRWGKNKASSPTDEQINLAQRFADAGADVILGTGTGVLQPVKMLSANRGDAKYHPVLCAYSLGNLFSHDRESRTTLASILLKTEVVYDSANDTVAFENLHYEPTYAWRGTENKRTLVRILLNDNEHYPSFVDKDQKDVMQRSYRLVTDVMADTGIPLAQ